MFTFREKPSEEQIAQVAKEFPVMDLTATKTFIQLMHTASCGYQMVNEYMGQFGLSHGRFLVMILLVRLYPDGLGPSDIAEKIGVTRATVSSLVEKLEREGLVLREHRTDDRRAVTVRPTDAGKELMRRILPGHLTNVKATMNPLTLEEREQLIVLLDKVQQGLAAIPSLNGDDSENPEKVTK